MNGARGGANQRWKFWVRTEEGVFAIAKRRRSEENVSGFSPLGFYPLNSVVLFGNIEDCYGPLDLFINVLSASQQNHHTILTEDPDLFTSPWSTQTSQVLIKP